MFNDECGLTQAVLDGRKTQTRRIVYTQNWFVVFDGEDFQLKKLDNGQALLTLCNNRFKTAHYKIGETIAIAQKYEDLIKNDEFYRLCGKNGMPLECIKYERGCNNKMFVRADLMPHHIRITNIRVERLQDISEEYTSPTMRIQSTTHKYQGCAGSFTSTFNSSSHDGLNVPLNLKPSFINNPISLHYD